MSRTTSLISILLPFILSFQFPGCGEPAEPPDPVMERFKDYYAGESVQREISRLGEEDRGMLEARLDSLRGHYGFSAAETDSLLGAIRESLPRWEVFLNDVLARIEEREQVLQPDTSHRKVDIPPPAG